MRVDAKTWVVTGAAGGIGRELVLLLVRRGARVAAVDLSAEGLTQTANLAASGDRVSTHVLDITDRDAVSALVDGVRQAHGPVDGLINNAGIIQPFVPFAELDDTAIRRVLEVNLMGTVHMLKAFLPGLLERPEAYVANVSSMGGFFPFPNQTMYGASKAAVKLLTEGLYGELQDTGVGVSVVLPGPVRTGIGAGAENAPSSAGESRMPLTEPDEAARIIVAGIEHEQLHIYVGALARLANLAIRIAPRRAILFVRQQMQAMLADQEQHRSTAG